MFSVQHDAGRPFVVAAGAGQVTVTGTRFDVRREADQTRVAVEAGTVKVQGRASDHIVTLTTGRGTHVDPQGQVAAAYAVNPEELTAWRNGKLVFNNATLVDVAREVSRYREQPLRVSTAAVGNLRLTSVFNSSDTDALLRPCPTSCRSPCALCRTVARKLFRADIQVFSSSSSSPATATGLH